MYWNLKALVKFDLNNVSLALKYSKLSRKLLNLLVTKLIISFTRVHPLHVYTIKYDNIRNYSSFLRRNIMIQLLYVIDIN